ncbi:hypothetical protein ACFYKX_18225 [Cytobacillus sp. FJAT-54145]|uniref:Uncharacterized protein n=1 Tax=Cytobacillus spartinae TaxID=3299023 RepID=A0ABW6KE50_9BACI
MIEELVAGARQRRKAEATWSAPTSTGDSDKEAVFASVGGVEVIEELVAGARTKMRLPAQNIKGCLSPRKMMQADFSAFFLL